MDDIVWLEDIPESERWRIAQTPRHFRVRDTEYVTTLGSSLSAQDLCIKKPPV